MCVSRGCFQCCVYFPGYKNFHTNKKKHTHNFFILLSSNHKVARILLSSSMGSKDTRIEFYFCFLFVAKSDKVVIKNSLYRSLDQNREFQLKRFQTKSVNFENAKKIVRISPKFNFPHRD